MLHLKSTEGQIYDNSLTASTKGTSIHTCICLTTNTALGAPLCLHLLEMLGLQENFDMKFLGEFHFPFKFLIIPLFAIKNRYASKEDLR